MEEILRKSVVVVQNIESQFNLEDLIDKPWSQADHSKFWFDFDNLVTVLKNEVNKLALVVDINDMKNPAKPTDVTR